MNHGPLLNIRSKTFYCSFIVFTVLDFSAIINKKPKTLLLSATIKKTQKELYFYVIYFSSCFVYCLIILIRSLVLDNHTVELGAQDKRLVLQVARRG